MDKLTEKECSILNAHPVVVNLNKVIVRSIENGVELSWMFDLLESMIPIIEKKCLELSYKSQRTQLKLVTPKQGKVKR